LCHRNENSPPDNQSGFGKKKTPAMLVAEFRGFDRTGGAAGEKLIVDAI